MEEWLEAVFVAVQEKAVRLGSDLFLPTVDSAIGW